MGAFLPDKPKACPLPIDGNSRVNLEAVELSVSESFGGGTLLSGRGTRRADILVEGEKIPEVGRDITRKADQIIDVTDAADARLHRRPYPF